MFKSSNFYFCGIKINYNSKRNYNISAINFKSTNNTKLSYKDLPLELKGLIIRRILNDSYLEITKGSLNTRMSNSHSIKQKEYIFHFYEQLKEFTKSPPKLGSYVLKSKIYETYKITY